MKIFRVSKATDLGEAGSRFRGNITWRGYLPEIEKGDHSENREMSFTKMHICDQKTYDMSHKLAVNPFDLSLWVCSSYAGEYSSKIGSRATRNQSFEAVMGSPESSSTTKTKINLFSIY